MGVDLVCLRGFRVRGFDWVVGRVVGDGVGRVGGFVGCYIILVLSEEWSGSYYSVLEGFFCKFNLV